MKRLLYSILLITAFSTAITINLHSDEFKVASFTGQTLGDNSGDFIDREVELRFNKDRDELLFIFDSVEGKTVFSFTKESREQFITILKLYEIWEKAAVKQKLTVVKEINSISCDMYWEHKGRWHNSAQEIYIKFLLYSHKADDQRLMLGFEKGVSYSDSSIKRGVNPLFLTVKESGLLQDYLSESFINEASQKSSERRLLIMAVLIFIMGLTVPIFIFLLVKTFKKGSPTV